jgi:hypothetical protein
MLLQALKVNHRLIKELTLDLLQKMRRKKKKARKRISKKWRKKFTDF